MRSTLLLLFAAGCACLAAASCVNNPALYTLGIAPEEQTASHVAPFESCPSPGQSCCTEAVAEKIRNYVSSFDEFTVMFKELVTGINNLNLGILTNLPTLIDIVDMVVPMIPDAFPKCTTIMKPGACNGDIVTALTEGNMECLEPFIRTLIGSLLTTSLPKVGGILYYIVAQWPTYSSILDHTAEQLGAYVDTLSCAACDPNFEAHKAAGSLYSMDTSDAALQGIRVIVDQLHDRFLDAVNTIGNIAVEILDDTHSQCEIGGSAPGYLIDSLLAVVQIPTRELWEIISFEITTYLNSIVTVIATTTPAVIDEYGVSKELLDSFVNWTDKCADGILYIAVDLISQLDLKSLGLDIDLSIITSLLPIVSNMLGNDIDIDYCMGATGENTFIEWVKHLVSILSADVLQLPKNMPWLQPDTIAVANAERAKMTGDVSIGAVVSPWALQSPVENPELGAPTGWLPTLSVNKLTETGSGFVLDPAAMGVHVELPPKNIQEEPNWVKFDQDKNNAPKGENIGGKHEPGANSFSTKTSGSFLTQLTSPIIQPYFYTAIALAVVAVVAVVAGVFYKAANKKKEQ